MSPELTSQLISRFPKLYCNFSLPQTESLMCRGFQFEDGWFDIIWELSEEIERVAIYFKFPIPQMEEIKQKFSGLRIRLLNYDLSFEDGRIEKAIIRVQEKAKTTCEKCGAIGKLFPEARYLQVLCDVHDKIVSKKLKPNKYPIWKMLKIQENKND